MHACFPLKLGYYSYNSFEEMIADSAVLNQIIVRYLNQDTLSSVFLTFVQLTKHLQTLCNQIYDIVDLNSEIVINNLKNNHFLSPKIDILINVENTNQETVVDDIREIYINEKKLKECFASNKRKFNEIILICSLLINDDIDPFF